MGRANHNSLLTLCQQVVHKIFQMPGIDCSFHSVIKKDIFHSVRKVLSEKNDHCMCLCRNNVEERTSTHSEVSIRTVGDLCKFIFFNG